MLPKKQIKEHAKFAVYTHLLSCFAIVTLATLIPDIVSAFVSARLFEGVDLTDISTVEALIKNPNFVNQQLLGDVLVFLSILFNMPFRYCMFRYFLVLSGSRPGVKCSYRVFFSGFENTSSALKGALAMIIIDIVSSFGIIIGYYPVYLAFCMAPFYIALNPKIGVLEALNQSRRLMKGHKKEAFVILLEFIAVSLGSSVLSMLGFGFFAFLMQTMSTSLINTCLAVMFVRLDRARVTENEAAL